jgi:hypothetical protein
MYPAKRLRKTPLDKPLLFTFRRRVQKGKFAGQYLFRMVAMIRVVAQTGTLLKVLAIEEWLRIPNVSSPRQGVFWFFEKNPDDQGNAALRSVYLQTIDEFPDVELPLLLGWGVQYPALGHQLTTKLTTAAG